MQQRKTCYGNHNINFHIVSHRVNERTFFLLFVQRYLMCLILQKLSIKMFNFQFKTKYVITTHLIFITYLVAQIIYFTHINLIKEVLKLLSCVAINFNMILMYYSIINNKVYLYKTSSLNLIYYYMYFKPTNVLIK